MSIKIKAVTIKQPYAPAALYLTTERTRNEKAIHLNKKR